MNLDANEYLFNFPVLQVREIMRYAMRQKLIGKNKTEINDKVAMLTHSSRHDAAKLINNLLQNDYLFQVKPERFLSNTYILDATEKGRKLGVAKATKPISREKANHMLRELIERAEKINSNPDFACCVSKLSVFGSFLSDKEQLGDLDVFYKISRRYETEKYNEVSNQSYQKELAKGRQFNSMIDEYLWPYKEVLLLLKSRKKSLSLHDEENDDVYSKTISQIVYVFDPKQ